VSCADLLRECLAFYATENDEAAFQVSSPVCMCALHFNVLYNQALSVSDLRACVNCKLDGNFDGVVQTRSATSFLGTS
jgi:hypothetical protein